MKFKAKLWKQGTSVILTVPATFIKTGEAYEGMDVIVEMKEFY